MIGYARGDKTNYNLQNVLRTIWLQPNVSRIQLAKQLDMDKATVSMIVNDLVAHHMVLEGPKPDAPPRPGRPPIGLRINGELGVMLGIELHVDHLNYVVTDMLHRERLVGAVATRVCPETLATSLNEVVSTVRNDPQLSGLPLLGVAVTVPGIVDQTAQTILFAPDIGIVDTPVSYAGMVEALEIPLLFANDANCCASGVLSQQRSDQLDSLLFVYLSLDSIVLEDGEELDHLSVGLGIVIDGSVYTGPDGMAGELQTMTTNPHRVGQFNVTREELRRLRTDRAVYTKVFAEIAEYVAITTTMMNFKHVYIGGDLDPFDLDVQELFYRRIIDSSPFRGRTISVRTLTGERFLPGKGAAGMLLDRLFSLPSFSDEGGIGMWMNVLKVVGF